MECFMDAFAFCIVVCLGIGVIALFVRIFNKVNTLPHARVKECYGIVLTLLRRPEYRNIPGNIYHGTFRNHTGDTM
jgi:hypothetical protein